MTVKQIVLLESLVTFESLVSLVWSLVTIVESFGALAESLVTLMATEFIPAFFQ